MKLKNPFSSKQPEMSSASDVQVEVDDASTQTPGAPDLHTNAHEAAHVVQQQGGVQARTWTVDATPPDASVAPDGGVTGVDDWEAPVARTTGGVMASDDWETPVARATGGGITANDDWERPVARTSVDAPEDAPTAPDLTQRAFTVDATGPSAISGQVSTASLPSYRVATGDVDGDGIADSDDLDSPEDASGLATGQRMHKPRLLAVDDDTDTGSAALEHGVVSPRDAASGMPTGRVATGDVTGDGVDDVVSPRDAASGLPTGRRMHEPFIISRATDDDADASRVGDDEGDGLDDGADEVTSPRDAASGLATGRRQHEPVVFTKATDDDADASRVAVEHEVSSPRDAASGMPTGRVASGDVDGDAFADNDRSSLAGESMRGPRQTTSFMDDSSSSGGDGALAVDHEVRSPRDAASGLATGRAGGGDDDGDGVPEMSEHEVTSPRDAASGLATGRRQYSPSVFRDADASAPDTDGDGVAMDHEVVSPRDAASGLATGRRQHSASTLGDTDASSPDTDGDGVAMDHEVTSPRDAASGLATGRRQYSPPVFRDADASTPDTDDNGLAIEHEVVSPRDAASGLPTGRIATGDVTGDGVEDVPTGDLDGDGAAERLRGPQKTWNPANFRETGSPSDTSGDEDNDGIVLEHEVSSPRDAASGMASGRVIDSTPARISTNLTTERQTQGASFGEKAFTFDGVDDDSTPNLAVDGGDADLDLDDDGPSTLLDFSSMSDGDAVVAVGDLDGDGLADLADVDIDTDVDSDSVDADDLMVS